ncbi:MAG: carboxypeptidase-like regulatory domain-containing protein [Acidobacteria bacterium]|nr:carboxypeptidase-like regulatory domain-containing protein [Acidobacteriota bacterium]
MTTPSRAALRPLALALLLVLAAAGLGAAPASEKKRERPYALIFGTVFGPDARAVAGVKVKIRRSDQKEAKWELHSDRRGEFAQRVPAGKADYVVWVDSKGPKNQLRQEVTVHVENDERVDIGLHLK